jgi:hypothetical protein
MAKKGISAMSTKQFIAIDQFGNCYPYLTHPRKDLLYRFGYQHIEKLWKFERGERTNIHIGYKIGRSRFLVYRMSRIGEEA